MKKRTKIRYLWYSLLIIIVTPCFAFACIRKESDTYHRKIHVSNNSDQAIYVSSNVGVGEKGPLYHFMQDKPEIFRVEPSETNSDALELYRRSYENVLQGDDMVIYIVDAYIVDNSTLDALLASNSGILRKYTFTSIDELRAIDFKIVYSGENHRTITIENDTDKAIYAYSDGGLLYEDIKSYPNKYRIEPFETNSDILDIGTNNAYEMWFNEYSQFQKYLFIHILDAHIVDNSTVDELRSSDIVVLENHFFTSIEELQAIDFEIVYSGED